MKPSRHLAASAAFSLALTPWLAWRSLLVLAGGALLDLDRYLWYVFDRRTLRLDKAISEFRGRDRIRGDPRIFHSVEFLLVLAAGGLIHPLVWVFGLGVVFHLTLDLLVHKKRGRFLLYLDTSHVHCLTLDWLRALAGRAAAKEADDRQPGPRA